MMSSFVNRIRHRNVLVYTIAGIPVIAAFAIGLTVRGARRRARDQRCRCRRSSCWQSGGNPATLGASRSEPGRSVCGQPVLHSPFNYDGAAGSYSSGRTGRDR